MYHIGATYLYNHNYSNKIQDILSEISNITKESVGMAVKDGEMKLCSPEIDIRLFSQNR